MRDMRMTSKFFASAVQTVRMKIDVQSPDEGVKARALQARGGVGWGDKPVTASSRLLCHGEMQT
jgi:hypothetical protein